MNKTPARLGLYPFDDLYSGAAQAFASATRDVRVWIAASHDHAANSGFDKGIAARRRASDVIAGLQCHADRMDARHQVLITTVAQQHRFGVVFSGAAMDGRGQKTALFVQRYGADRWVRPCGAHPLARFAASALHGIIKRAFRNRHSVYN